MHDTSIDRDIDVFLRNYVRKSLGSVFALNANGLMLKIEELLLLFPQDIVFTDDGGIRLLQFKKQFSEIEILTHYYEAQFVTVG